MSHPMDHAGFIEECRERLSGMLLPFGVQVRAELRRDPDPRSYHWDAEFGFYFLDRTQSPAIGHAFKRPFRREEILLDRQAFPNRLPYIAREVLYAFLNAVMVTQQPPQPPDTAAKPNIWSGCPSFIGDAADEPMLVPKAPSAV